MRGCQYVVQRPGIGLLFALADPQIRIAITCIHGKPGYPWTLQELADRVGMSRTVFAQRFKQRVGTTVMEYLTRWRMSLAGDRLSGTHDSVSVISATLGYETESAFGRAFRRFWGHSPREYVDLLVQALHKYCLERMIIGVV
jgi:AraC-like DNA-binding protein